MKLAGILGLVLWCTSSSAVTTLDCATASAELASPHLRVSLLQSLPQSKRFGVALVIELKDGPPVLAIGGGVTVGHSDLIQQAKQKYGSRIAGTRMWGEVQIENKTFELGVGEITAATPTSGTWYKEYQKQPGHSNASEGLAKPLENQQAIRFNSEGLREFDKNQEHLHPMLVGRHKANNILAGTMTAMEAMTTSYTEAPPTEQEFMSSYNAYAPKMGKRLVDLGLYLDGMVNDGAMTHETRQSLQSQIDTCFGAHAQPTLERVQHLYTSLDKALEPSRQIARDPAPYVEFIQLDPVKGAK